MQVILQEKIKNLGGIGDIVEVSPGFARNYLLRNGKALSATKDNVAVVEKKRSELEKLEKEKISKAKVRVAALEKVGLIELTVHTNEEGKLFGSVVSGDIADFFEEKGHSVHKSEISILEAPVRFIGEFTVHVECYTGVNAELKMIIRSDSIKEKEDEKEINSTKNKGSEDLRKDQSTSYSDESSDKKDIEDKDQDV